MQVCRQESKYAGMHVHMVDKTEPKVPPPTHTRLMALCPRLPGEPVPER